MKKEEKGKDKDKEKKEQKIVYIDDGSTIADMSGTFRGGKKPDRPRSTFRERWQTYISVVKKMILPMLITLLAFTAAFILLYWAMAGF